MSAAQSENNVSYLTALELLSAPKFIGKVEPAVENQQFATFHLTINGKPITLKCKGIPGREVKASQFNPGKLQLMFDVSGTGESRIETTWINPKLTFGNTDYAIIVNPNLSQYQKLTFIGYAEITSLAIESNKYFIKAPIVANGGLFSFDTIKFNSANVSGGLFNCLSEERIIGNSLIIKSGGEESCRIAMANIDSEHNINIDYIETIGSGSQEYPFIGGFEINKINSIGRILIGWFDNGLTKKQKISQIFAPNSYVVNPDVLNMGIVGGLLNYDGAISNIINECTIIGTKVDDNIRIGNNVTLDSVSVSEYKFIEKILGGNNNIIQNCNCGTELIYAGENNTNTLINNRKSNGDLIPNIIPSDTLFIGKLKCNTIPEADEDVIRKKDIEATHSTFNLNTVSNVSDISSGVNSFMDIYTFGELVVITGRIKIEIDGLIQCASGTVPIPTIATWAPMGGSIVSGEVVVTTDGSVTFQASNHSAPHTFNFSYFKA